PMKTTPYWWEEAPRQPSAAFELPDCVDVAVIGAGFTGLCAALVVARGGASVALFEAGEMGAGASTLNGGMVGPSFHKLGIAGLKAKFGEGRANAILRESIGFVDYLEKFIDAEGIDADFKRTGRFRGALRPAHYDAMARELEILQETIGVEGTLVSKADQHQETGSPRFHGGIVLDRDGGLHPAKYHDGLVRRVSEADVIIATKTAITGIEKTASGFTLDYGRGKIRAGQIAVCTNGYTGPVTQDLRRRVIPLRSSMIATAPLQPELMKHLMPKARVYGDSRRVVAYYRPSPDGTRILFGGRAASLKDTPMANVRTLRSFMEKVYPQLTDVVIDHVWSGLVAYTFDHAPHIGQFGGGKQDGMFYAMGYCGSGVARSTYFGNKLGLKILGKADGETAFDDLAFESRPLYGGYPWFMPAVMTWHRLADRLGL
ncbi:MAG: FAD-binding oxidoreductase, partial [Rhodospirillales bacterium]|nr:FAD-binding oxidoreductase [Rhodospirillales bacterium]